ncbi:ImmA/IrrE family metallo-endopeptidase [Nocardioides sp. AN3]
MGLSQREEGELTVEDQMEAIGERIRSRMSPGSSQRRLAADVGMPPDALSRALNGQRGFAPLELARIADALGADIHWLITGTSDPLRVDIAARHAWDPLRGQRVNPGRERDEQILQNVVRAYRTAYPEGPPASTSLPTDPHEVRRLLPAEFVRGFADVAERWLGVDVIRVPDVSTDYSLRIGARGVILLASTPHWFRSNWSLAHEIGHLALGHHDDGAHPERHERPADTFAASLLLPESFLAGPAWARLTRKELATVVWESGVSTEVLRRRLRDLRLPVDEDIREALGQPTQRLLRSHVDSLGGGEWGDPIANRERDSSARRFPLGLLSALAGRVEQGVADPRVLAWALDVPIDEIDFPEPDDGAGDAYVEVLATRSSAAEWAQAFREGRSPEQR